MISAYSAPGTSPGAAAATRDQASASVAPSAPAEPRGGGYLNEVSPLTARSGAGDQRGA
jgi:hypothetical protein